MRLSSQRWSSRGFRYSYTASRPVQTSSGSSHLHVGVKPTRESCARLEPSTRYQSTIPRSQLLLLGWGAWEWDERGPTGLLISWGSCEGIFAACNLKPTSSCVCLAERMSTRYTGWSHFDRYLYDDDGSLWPSMFSLVQPICGIPGCMAHTPFHVGEDPLSPAASLLIPVRPGGAVCISNAIIPIYPTSQT